MDWLKKLKEYAPDIASAVVTGGATLPALAVKAISDAVGQDIKNETDLADFVTSATPEQMLKVKQADNAFKIQMRQLDNEMEIAELKDMQNAREHHKQSRMPAAICLALTIMVAGGGLLLFKSTIPDGNNEIAYLLFGTLLAKWGDSIAYWVGTTRSSSLKTIMMNMQTQKR